MPHDRDVFSATTLTGRELSKARAKAEEFARKKVIEAGDFSVGLGVPVRDMLLTMMQECRALCLCSMSRADQRAFDQFELEQVRSRRRLARQRANVLAESRAKSKRSSRS